MSWLLDTNVCVAYLNGTDPGIRDHVLQLGAAQIFLCSVVKGELLYGARNSTRVDSNLLRLRDFFAPFPSLPFDDQAASCYGSLRAQLKREGRLIGANDLMIAAIALAADLTLVTRNQDEFARVTGLRITDWSQAGA